MVDLYSFKNQQYIPIKFPEKEVTYVLKHFKITNSFTQYGQ